MGRNLSTGIVFGFDIGGHEDGWNFEENTDSFSLDDDWYAWWPSWMEREEGEEPEDPVTQIIEKMLKEVGGWVDSEDWLSADPAVFKAYYERKKAAEAKLGITEDMYGTDGWSGWVIGFQLTEGSYISEVDPDAFEGLDFHRMTQQLLHAFEVTGLTPKDQPQPRLLSLASYF
jgi:hypothetical protein